MFDLPFIMTIDGQTYGPFQGNSRALDLFLVPTAGISNLSQDTAHLIVLRTVAYNDTQDTNDTTHQFEFDGFM